MEEGANGGCMLNFIVSSPEQSYSCYNGAQGSSDRAHQLEGLVGRHHQEKSSGQGQRYHRAAGLSSKNSTKLFPRWAVFLGKNKHKL